MPKGRSYRILSALFAFLLTFGGAHHILQAQNAPENQETSPSLSSPAAAADEQALKRYGFLNLVREELAMAQRDYANIRKNTEGTEQKLETLKAQALSLETQLRSLDQQMNNTIDLIENILYQITIKENEVKKLEQDLEVQKAEVERQKQVFLDYVRILYEQDNRIIDTNSPEEATINITKLLLLQRPVEQVLQERQYFDVLTRTGQELYERLETLMQSLQDKKTKTENARNRLEMLYRQLEEEREQLAYQRSAKSRLLVETQGQQAVYEDLLEESKREQAETLRDIEALRNNLRFIQQKVNELGGKFNPEDFKDVLDPATTSLFEYLQNEQGENDTLLMWPVSPSQGITAYFRDSGYLGVFGVPHNAIDIRSKQGTPIKAPAEGIVFKAKDNGFGYSFIILAHRGGLMTVYGHVSEIRVKEGEKIQRGQVIGLSGAMPGTKGAGLMTTGPHLHFEVLKGGKHVDPLDYLPLAYLPLDSLPAKYLQRVTGEQVKIKRQLEDEHGSEADLLQRVELNGTVETSDAF